MQLAALLIAAAYALPDGPALPVPDAVRKRRIAQALELVRRGDPDKADVAVRELALVGEAALPAIVARLNRARAGERLLLLASVRRMGRGAALLAQAGSDANAAIRVWASGPPPREEPDLRLLAARYLDLLAVAEEKKRVDADRDLANLEPRVGRPAGTLGRLRERMRDRRLSAQVQYERSLAAARFARVGGLALRGGSLKASLDNPVFMAYLALLREESGPAGFYAVPSLVATGRSLAPVLEPLLDREQHDPRKILRILFSVREDRGRGLYGSFSRRVPKAQRALVHLAPGVLTGRELVRFFEEAAQAVDGTVRGAALDELLALGGPVAVETARALLDPTRFTMNEFRRAARLLARAGVVEPLAEHAELEVPQDNTANSARLSQLQRAAVSVLRSYRGEQANRLAERFYGSESPRLKSLGLDMARDPKRLLELARAAAEPKVAHRLARRVIEVGDDPAARAAIALLRRGGEGLPLSLFQALRRRGFTDLLVELAAGPDSNEARHALGQLAQFNSLDRRHEAALLEIHRRAPSLSTLEALLPLGTPAVQLELNRADREHALDAVAGRAETMEGVAATLPLLDLVKGAGAKRLIKLQRAASVLPEVQPGLHHALFLAWDRIEPAPEKQPGNSRGAAVEKVEVLLTLARSKDKRSARLLLDAVLQRSFKQPPMVLGTLRAAARLLGARELMGLVPQLAGLVEAEHPDSRKEPPAYDAHRAALLRGGLYALGYARVEAALPRICDFLLDPGLQPAAFGHRARSPVPGLVLLALRLYPGDRVDAAFRAALKRAEDDGRLARLAPDYLFGLIREARGRRNEGRGLPEVRLALCEVLERLPWEGDEHYEKMRALGALRRYAAAANAARTFAADQRARGYRAEDGLRTPKFMEGRALLYEALANKHREGFAKAWRAVEPDPFLLNLMAWYVHFHVQDPGDLAERAATRAVRDSAGLFHPYRDTLAAIRIRQDRPADALRLLDSRRLLPDERRATSGWFLYFQAQAHFLDKDERAARRDLEQALNQDRRLVQFAKADPVFSKWTALFQRVEEDYVDMLFR